MLYAKEVGKGSEEKAGIDLKLEGEKERIRWAEWRYKILDECGDIFYSKISVLWKPKDLVQGTS